MTHRAILGLMNMVMFGTLECRVTEAKYGFAQEEPLLQMLG